MIDIDQYDDEFGGPPNPTPDWVAWALVIGLIIFIGIVVAW